jgi:hypothetical protein
MLKRKTQIKKTILRLAVIFSTCAFLFLALEENSEGKLRIVDTTHAVINITQTSARSIIPDLKTNQVQSPLPSIIAQTTVPLSIPPANIPTITPTTMPTAKVVSTPEAIDNSTLQKKIAGGQTPIPTQTNNTGILTTQAPSIDSNTTPTEYQYWNIISPEDQRARANSALYFSKENIGNEGNTPLKDIIQKENYFEINADAGTRIFLIATTNSCSSLASMTFKTRNKIMGRITITENMDLSVPLNKSTIYSTCEIKTEGFANTDLADTRLRIRYTEDWKEKNSINPDNLRVLLQENEGFKQEKNQYKSVMLS